MTALSLLLPVMMLGNAYEDYIARYSAMAVEQMRLYGVPASITLAQGCLRVVRVGRRWQLKVTIISA